MYAIEVYFRLPPTVYSGSFNLSALMDTMFHRIHGRMLVAYQRATTQTKETSALLLSMARQRYTKATNARSLTDFVDEVTAEFEANAPRVIRPFRIECYGLGPDYATYSRGAELHLDPLPTP